MKPDNMLLAGAVLAGVSVATDASAASMTVESSFVLRFEDESSLGEVFSFDPFSGPAEDLTGVTMTLDSLLVTGTPFASTVLFVSNVGGPIVGSDLFNSGDVEYDFDRDLFSIGMVASDFVGGPVEFRAAIDVEEAVSTGIWYAGEDPSGGGGGGIIAPPDFGSVSLTYFYDDVPEVPLPASLFLLGGAIGALAATKKRRAKH